jgi:hypothetical protein
MQPMPQPDPERCQRLLAACRKGLNHDLVNQLIALQGLLQLLQLDETPRLSDVGQDIVRRLLGVGRRTQTLVETLGQLARLGDNVMPAEVLVLAGLAEEAMAAFQPPPAFECHWEAAKILAPRALVLRALTAALRLLAETAGGTPILYRFSSRSMESIVELTAHAVSLGQGPSGAPPGGVTRQLPRNWHERPECVLLRESAGLWGGAVQWQWLEGGVTVLMTFDAPR